MVKGDKVYWARIGMDINGNDFVEVRRAEITKCGVARVSFEWTHGRMQLRRASAERVLQPTVRAALEVLQHEVKHRVQDAERQVIEAKRRVELVAAALNREI